MKSFEELYQRALDRKGEQGLLDRLPQIKSKADLTATGDDRFLAAIAKCVFAAGFRWKVVQIKWPGFEEAFEGFAPEIVGGYGAERIDELRNDTRIIRNPQKIRATIENAHFVQEQSYKHNGFGRFVAEWPDNELVGLWDFMAKHGTRLGGSTGPRVLRSVGRDTFILTPDVAWSLTEQKIISNKPTSKKARKQALDAFLEWQQESGRPMAEISVIIACSVDRPQ